MLTVKEALDKGWSKDNAPKFVAWLDSVDCIVASKLGVGIDDLPDWDFASAFVDEMAPGDAAAVFVDDLAVNFGLDLDLF